MDTIGKETAVRYLVDHICQHAFHLIVIKHVGTGSGGKPYRGRKLSHRYPGPADRVRFRLTFFERFVPASYEDYAEEVPQGNVPATFKR